MFKKYFFIIILGWACILFAEPEAPEFWYHVLSDGPPPNPVFAALELSGVGAEDGHLFGYFRYSAEKEGVPRSADVILRGRRKLDDTFWPDVTVQVSDEWDSGWETINSSETEGEITMQRVSAGPERVPLYVVFDVFRTLMGKRKYGRVVLDTGDTEAFSLDVLLPPKLENKSKATN